MNVLLAALLYVSPNGLPAGGPWLTDYGKALEIARKQDKPVLVVFRDNAAKAVPARLEKKDRLTDEFVLLIADKSTAAGRRLFDLFEVKSANGVVVVEREQEWQFCRYERDLSGKEVETLLKSASHAKGKPESDPLQSVSEEKVSWGVSDSYCPSCSRRR